VLQETENSALEGYVHWLYTNCIIETKEEDDPFHFRELFELYLLGDFLKDTRFCQNVMAAIIRRGKDGVYLPTSSEMFAMSGRDLPSSLTQPCYQRALACRAGGLHHRHVQECDRSAVPYGLRFGPLSRTVRAS
jgi:hypothetical protein